MSDNDTLHQRLSLLEGRVNAIPDPVASTTTTTATSTGGGTPTLLSGKTVVFSTVAAAAWMTYDASAVVPAGATWLFCEMEYAITQPDVAPFDAYVNVRAKSGAMELMIAHGRASGTADNNAACYQVMIQLGAGRVFDYEILLGFDANCELRIIGYYS